jgi:hypothetical protein
MENNNINQDTYLAYIANCNEIGIRSLSKEEIQNLSIEEVESHTAEINKLGLNPALVVNVGAAANGILNMYSQVTGKDLRDQAVNWAKDQFSGRGINADKIIDVIDRNTGGGGSGSGSNGTSGKKNRSFDYNNHPISNLLSMNTKPIEVKLNTGIRNHGYTQLELTPDGTYTPMHVLGADFSFDTSDPVLKDFVNKCIIFDVQNRTQGAVSFGINTNNDFSADKILGALNAIAFALNIFYYHASIIAYCDSPSNRNDGMFWIRQQFSADELNKVSILLRILQGTPCPPNLKEFLFYLNGNFKASSEPNSPIIKIVPVRPDFKIDSVGLIDEAIMNLNSYRGVFQILARAFPSWVTVNLPSYGPVVMHDVQFTTLFNQAPCSYLRPTLGTIYTSPKSFDDRTAVHFTTKTDELDGAVEALCSIDVSGDPTKTDWRPGLLTPVLAAGDGKNGISNKTSYSLISGITYGFVDSSMQSNNYNINRGDSYNFDSASFQMNTVMPFGSEQVLGMSVQAIRQSAQMFTQYLMSFDSMPSKSSSGFKTDSKPKGRSRRSK